MENSRVLLKKNDIYIPKVYPHLTSERVLVMEWIEGIKITDKEKL